MHTPEEQPRDGGDLFEEIQVANVADLRAMRRNCTITIVIRHSDLSRPVSYGTFYLAGSLGRILEALEENIPEFVSDMETGVSEERSAALSSADFLRAIFGSGVVVEGVVPDSEER